jgi:hypothetical protein
MELAALCQCWRSTAENGGPARAVSPDGLPPHRGLSCATPRKRRGVRVLEPCCGRQCYQ